MRVPVLLTGLALLAACARSDGGAPVVYRGTDPAAPRPQTSRAAAAAPSASPSDARVVDYGGYSAIVAGPGDTVESLAARVGVSASELAAYNGLPAGHRPQPGDELILPPREGGWSGEIETASLEAPAASAQPAPGETETSRFDLAEIGEELGAEPRAAPAAPAPAATPSPPAETRAAAPSPPAETRGADPAPAPAIREADPAPQRGEQAVGPETAAAPAAPDEPVEAEAAFSTPVEGRISRAYGEGGGEGVDFAAPAGAPVRAAADGQVALVSESLGGYGTIVLVRHRDRLLTLYGRVERVSVSKGDRVARGQQIGVVAPAEEGEPSLHFEVRRGVESVDPAGFLPG